MFILKKILFTILLVVSASASNNINLDKKMKMVSNGEKNIIIFFHIPSCNYCETMLNENFTSKKILKELDNDFILVDIYTKDKGIIIYKDFKGTHKEFAKYMKVAAYPATYFIDKNGNILYKSIGYRNIEEYYKEIKYISSKRYKQIDLETFIQEIELKDDEW